MIGFLLINRATHLTPTTCDGDTGCMLLKSHSQWLNRPHTCESLSSCFVDDNNSGLVRIIAAASR